MEALFEKIKAMRTKDEPRHDPGLKILVGLGNKGREYQDTRHNIGFKVMDELAGRSNEKFSRVEHQALVAKVSYQGQRLVLAKPQTYMNNSGISVKALQKFYKVSLEDILIIYDEVDLEFGVIRLRPEGGSAGHKGLKSIMQHLGTDEFPRLRVGVGRPPGKMQTPDHVLQDFSKAQQEELPLIIQRAADAAQAFVTDGIIVAMNTYNQKV